MTSLEKTPSLAVESTKGTEPQTELSRNGSRYLHKTGSGSNTPQARVTSTNRDLTDPNNGFVFKASNPIEYSPELKMSTPEISQLITAEIKRVERTSNTIQPTLILLVAPSGSGKSTFKNDIMDAFTQSSLDLGVVDSSTSRDLIDQTKKKDGDISREAKSAIKRACIHQSLEKNNYVLWDTRGSHECFVNETIDQIKSNRPTISLTMISPSVSINTYIERVGLRSTSEKSVKENKKPNKKGIEEHRNFGSKFWKYLQKSDSTFLVSNKINGKKGELILYARNGKIEQQNEAEVALFNNKSATKYDITREDQPSYLSDL